MLISLALLYLSSQLDIAIAFDDQPLGYIQSDFMKVPDSWRPDSFNPGKDTYDPVHETNSSGNGTYNLGMVRRQTPEGNLSSFSDLFSSTLYSSTLYYLNLTIGTPPKKVGALLDTGSSNFWIQSVNSPACKTADSGGQVCRALTEYDEGKSSTANLTQRNGSSFEYISSSVSANLWEDDVVIGKTSLKDFPFGIATSTVGAQVFGVVGLGPTEGAFSNINDVAGGGGKTTSFLDDLKGTGLINSRSFSLYISEEGPSSVVFGGYDSSRFTGDLKKLPLNQDAPYNTAYNVQISTIGYTIPGSSKSYAANSTFQTYAALDSGSSYSVFPLETVTKLYSDLGMKTPKGTASDDRTVDCKYQDAKNTLDLQLGAYPDTVSIEVPFSNIVLKNSSVSAGNVCFLNILAVYGPSAEIILGSGVFLSYYTVFDLDNQEIALASVDSTNDTPNIKTIPGSGITS